MADDSLPPTRWSIVLRARGPLVEGSEGGAAFRELYLIYSPALYGWARARGLIREDAEDAVQSFWERASAGTLFENAIPGRGRLRGYLRQAFTWHLQHLRHRETTLKRGGTSKPLRMDENVRRSVERELAGSGRTPDRVYDYFCALAVWMRAVEHLRTELTAENGPELAEALMRQLDPVNGSTLPVDEISVQFGMTPNTFRQRLRRLRPRFHALLRSFVSETLEDPSPGILAAELEELCRALMD